MMTAVSGLKNVELFASNIHRRGRREDPHPHTLISVKVCFVNLLECIATPVNMVGDNNVKGSGGPYSEVLTVPQTKLSPLLRRLLRCLRPIQLCTAFSVKVQRHVYLVRLSIT